MTGESILYSHRRSTPAAPFKVHPLDTGWRYGIEPQSTLRPNCKNIHKTTLVSQISQLPGEDFDGGEGRDELDGVIPPDLGTLGQGSEGIGRATSVC
jgi:hypothetical protein